MKKTTAIRNVRAFVRSYLKGKNGARHLKARRPLAAEFERAVA